MIGVQATVPHGSRSRALEHDLSRYHGCRCHRPGRRAAVRRRGRESEDRQPSRSRPRPSPRREDRRRRLRRRRAHLDPRRRVHPDQLCGPAVPPLARGVPRTGRLAAHGGAAHRGRLRDARQPVRLRPGGWADHAGPAAEGDRAQRPRAGPAVEGGRRLGRPGDGGARRAVLRRGRLLGVLPDGPAVRAGRDGRRGAAGAGRAARLLGHPRHRPHAGGRRPGREGPSAVPGTRRR